MESPICLPDFSIISLYFTIWGELYLFIWLLHLCCVFSFVQCFDFDGKEMMREMGNDMEKWNHGYNNNHVVKMKGTFVDERNRKKVHFGDALVFIVMTGQCAECKMVPSVYRSRHFLIQDLPQWKYCWGWQEFTLLFRFMRYPAYELMLSR